MVLIIEKISISEWFEVTNKEDGYRCTPPSLTVTCSFGRFYGEVPIQYIPLHEEHKIRVEVCKALSIPIDYALK